MLKDGGNLGKNSSSPTPSRRANTPLKLTKGCPASVVPCVFLSKKELLLQNAPLSIWTMTVPGQYAKYSVQADVFCSASKLGYCSTPSPLRICATGGRPASNLRAQRRGLAKPTEEPRRPFLRRREISTPLPTSNRASARPVLRDLRPRIGRTGRRGARRFARG
jgi:hypothetical protein